MSDLPNHLGNPPQRPQFSAKTTGAGTAQQGRREPLPANRGESGVASGPTGPLRPSLTAGRKG